MPQSVEVVARLAEWLSVAEGEDDARLDDVGVDPAGSHLVRHPVPSPTSRGRCQPWACSKAVAMVPSRSGSDTSEAVPSMTYSVLFATRSRAWPPLRRRAGGVSGAMGSSEMAGSPASGLAADRHDAHGQGQSSKGQVPLVVVAQTHACPVPFVASSTPSRGRPVRPTPSALANYPLWTVLTERSRTTGSLVYGRGWWCLTVLGECCRRSAEGVA